MNISLWLGVIVLAGLVKWVVGRVGVSTFGDWHGPAMVLGGMATAMLINCSLSQLFGAAVRFFSLFMPSGLPSIEEAIVEGARLARKAQREGGLLSIQNESRDFAGGFLHRALVVAISAGESAETRKIMETEIKQLRVARQEEANVFRTMGVLSPMFGLLGTLVGMINVLQNMSDPNKASTAMALALSSAFIGIGFANFICVPISGLIRLEGMRETLLYEVLLEAALDIAAGKAPYLLELHLAAYSRRRRQEMETAPPSAGTRTPAGGPAEAA